MKNDYSELRSQYPEFVSGDQLYRICHICKRKAKWLLDNGVIPFEDTGKKTHRYRIRLDDVIHYLNTKDNAPAPPRGSITCPKPKTWHPICTADAARGYLTELWSIEPDALTVEQAAKLSGYSPCSVRRWIKTGSLTAIWHHNRYRILKDTLIESMAEKGQKSADRLSKRHVQMLEKAAAQQGKEDVILL